ncbi:hypothetical protein C8F01DRAFT_1249461 [Mycena amicta]|nr:hypothetical protein C8F01DRAFT_1249461 [Mycena amicta]
MPRNEYVLDSIVSATVAVTERSHEWMYEAKCFEPASSFKKISLKAFWKTLGHQGNASAHAPGYTVYAPTPPPPQRTTSSRQMALAWSVLANDAGAPPVHIFNDLDDTTPEDIEFLEHDVRIFKNDLTHPLPRAPTRSVPLTIFKVDAQRGWGVRSSKNIPAGSTVSIYTGERLTSTEANPLADTTYLWRLHDGSSINARSVGKRNLPHASTLLTFPTRQRDALD